MADRVRVQKREYASTGGDGADDVSYIDDIDPSEDGVDCRSVFLQNDSSADSNVEITRDASDPDNLTFKDEVQTTPLTLTELLSPTVGAEPVGFPNRTDSTLSFVDLTRTFTIAPAVTSFDFYVEFGVKYTKSTGQSTVIPDTEGLHFIYFDTAGVLQNTITFTDDIILKYAFVSVVYWDATNSVAIYIGDERHGLVMDGVTHLHWHNTFGTSFYSGLALTGLLTDENGSLDTHAQLGTASGTIADEDIRFSVSVDAAPAQIPVFYRDGASGDWRRKTKDDFPVYSFSGGSNRLAWNELTGGSWQQTEVSNNNFVLAHLFTTNDTSQPWIAIQGQAEYGNIAAAQEGAVVELTTLVLDGLPAIEFVAVATVIFQTSNAYSNTPKARTRSTGDGDWIDWRFTGVSPVSTPSVETDIFTTFVFRPGGTAGGNVYTDFGLLYSALISTQGHRVLQFDTTFAACTVPAGTYDMKDVIWRGVGSRETVVTLVEGVVLQNLRRIEHWLKVDFSGTTPPITDLTTNLDFLWVREGASLTCSGAGPMIRKSDAGTVQGGMFLAGGSLVTGTNAVVDISTSGGQFFFFYVYSSSQVQANTISGVAGTLVYHGINSPSTTISFSQASFSGGYLADHSFSQFKSGRKLNVDFVQSPGQPWYADVTFANQFIDDQYDIGLSASGSSNRSYNPSWSNKTASGFRIELNTRNKNSLVSVDFRCQHYTSVGVT